MAQTSTLSSVLTDLTDASHILHFFGIVDAFGHISARHPENPDTYIMSHAIAPGLCSSDDLNIYRISDSELIREIRNGTSVPLRSGTSHQDSRKDFSERFIHSEIYKAYPSVMSVVHAHTTEVLPFANARQQLWPQSHTTGFLGSANGTPIFDFTAALSRTSTPPPGLSHDHPHDFLIKNSVLGQELALSFRPGSHVVLMTGHGMTVRGASIRDAVYRVYYTKEAAIIQMQTLHLSSPGTVIPPFVLTEKEAADCQEVNESEAILGRLWAMWTAQVDNVPMYKSPRAKKSRSRWGTRPSGI